MTTQAPANAPDDFSLVLGGPLYQLYLRTRLVRPPVDLVRRRIIAAILLTWAPLAVLALLGGRAFGGGVEVPFIKDLTAHAQLLVALPLLLLAESIVHQRIKVAVAQFIDRELIAPEDRPRFHEAIASARAMRNSVFIEVSFLIISFTLGYWLWKQRTLHATSWFANNIETGELTLAGYWYAFFSLSLFRFILLRWYYRLFLWYRFLWQVSRIPLRLNPLHPDRAGGLGFLSGSALAILPILLAHTVLLSAQIGDRIWHEGATLPQFKMEIAVIILYLLLIAFAPQMFFLFQLGQARRAGAREYGVVASAYVNRFREKWLRQQREGDENILGTADIQSLADLGNSFEVVGEMRVFPFTKKAVISLAIVLVLPLAPLLLTMIPLDEIAERAIKLVL